MNTEMMSKLVAEYLEAGGTVTKLAAGEYKKTAFRKYGAGNLKQKLAGTLSENSKADA